MAHIDWFDKELTANVEAATRKSIRKGCVIVARSARAKCPVGIEEREVAQSGKNAGKPWTARKPGTLKKSIRTRMSKKKLSGQVIAGNKMAYYAICVERGTSKTIAVPYMRPALESNMQAVEECFKDTMK